MKNNNLLLIDGNALIHRAYHALPPDMATSKGELTNAVYGFTSALIHALETIKPTNVICCFDVKGPTFRNEMYKEYKANRKEMDDELVGQLPRVREVVEAFNIPIVTESGYEADDLIGSLASKFSKDMDVTILTGDKDALQLVSGNVSVETFKQGFRQSVLYTPKVVVDQYGISPEEFVAFKALRGDPSDNIPGVSGVGEVTATKLVQQYHGIDSLYDALKKGDLPTGAGEKIVKTLKAEEKVARLSEALAKIKTDIQINIDVDETVLDLSKSIKVRGVFESLEFKTFWSRIEKLARYNSDVTVKNTSDSYFGKVVNEKEFLAILSGCNNRISLCFEYVGEPIWEAKITTVGCSIDGRLGYATEWNNQIKQNINNLISNVSNTVLFEDSKNAYHLYKNYGLEILSNVMDIELGCLLLQKDNPMVVNKKSALSLFDKNIEECATNAAKIFIFGSQVEKELIDNKLINIWNDIEKPLVTVLCDMERAGVRVDSKVMDEMSKVLNTRAEKIEKDVWEIAGQEFNILSPQQLNKILFEKLHISTVGLKKRVQGFSTDNEALQGLKIQNPIAGLVLEYRELKKLINTYLDALPKLVDKKDHRLHSVFNQLGAATGRLSSSDPNLQNIPIRTELGGEIRKAFIAEAGNVLVKADYSQIELRILAHLSGDEEMKKSFMSGADIHTITAAKIHQIDPGMVTKELRRAAKTINFGILYGLSAHSLSNTLGISFAEAKAFIERYFETFPSVKKYLESIVEKAKKDGCDYTMFGRRRLFPELSSPNWIARSAAERMATNFPMQGTQADIIKMAMIAVHNEYKDNKDVRMILSVHDELLFEVKKGVENEVAKKVAELMAGVCKLSVPIVAEVEVGSSWGEMRAVGF